MPTYIALLKWTPQGLQNVKQSPSRLDAARKGFQAAGVTMKTFLHGDRTVRHGRHLRSSR